MRIIEFTGPPGSGKSTICAALKTAMARRGIEVCDASDLVLQSGRYPFDRHIWLRLMSFLPRRVYQKCLRGANNYLYLKHECRTRFLLEHLPMFEEVQSRLCSMSLPEHRRQGALDLILQTGGRYQMALEAPNPLAVFLQDEGFAHRAITLFASLDEAVPDAAVIEAYVDSAPRCQAVIRVEADLRGLREAAARTAASQEVDGASEHEVETFVSRAVEVIDIAMKVLGRTGVPLFTIRNIAEPFPSASIAAQMDGIIEAFLEHPHSEKRDGHAAAAGIGISGATLSPPLSNP